LIAGGRNFGYEPTSFIDPVLTGLSTLHSGDVRQYVMWMAVGLAIFSLAFSVL
jgi:hypothetical protein